jgi:hypothetical protein
MAGRSDCAQVEILSYRRLRSGAPRHRGRSAGARQLDQKLWVALSCPVEGTELDEKTLALIDTDKDGKIRAPEILAAVKWAGSVLKDASALLKGSPRCRSRRSTRRPRRASACSRRRSSCSSNLGKKGAKEVTLDDTADQAKIFAETKLNGDGVVPPGSADDEAVKKAIEEVLACMGGETDRSGAQGVTQEKVDAFFTEAQAYADWWKAAESDAAKVLPLGEGTAAPRSPRPRREGEDRRLLRALPPGGLRRARRGAAQPRAGRIRGPRREGARRRRSPRSLPSRSPASPPTSRSRSTTG